MVGGTPIINTTEGFPNDKKTFEDKTWIAKQPIEVPQGMTQNEFDELVIENADKYDKDNSLNEYPPFGGILDPSSRNSNTFVDNVSEESGGQIRDFEKAFNQNTGEDYEEFFININKELFDLSEENLKTDIRSFRGFK